MASLSIHFKNIWRSFFAALLQKYFSRGNAAFGDLTSPAAIAAALTVLYSPRSSAAKKSGFSSASRTARSADECVACLLNWCNITPIGAAHRQRRLFKTNTNQGQYPTSDDSDSEAKAKKHAKLPIPHWMLRDPVFDFAKGMGTLCREQRKWSFDRRDKAAEAYYKVFRDEKQTLRTIFDCDDLRWLAAVRNNLIHSAGKVDKEFQTLAKDHPEFCDLPIDTPLPLTGENVAKMINVADGKGVALIDFVNKWLNANPR